MKCPIFTIASTLAEKERGLFWYDCIKEGCAWWDEQRFCCESRSTRIELSRLVERLDEIIQKMPYPPAP